MTADRRRSRNGRAAKHRPCSGALTPFEIAVRRRKAILPGGNLVCIHRQAGRTSRLPQFEPRRCKDPIQPFGSRGRLDRLRSGDDPYRYPFGAMTALDKMRKAAEVLDTSIGATADKDIIHRFAQQPLAGGETRMD